MKRLSIVAAAAVCISCSVRAADEKKLTVVDYYLLLPDKTFEAPVRDWLNNATVIDKENGYMNITGDGGAAELRSRTVSLSRWPALARGLRR